MIGGGGGGGGGGQKAKLLMEIVKVMWDFQRGGGSDKRIPTMGVV